MTHRVVTLCPGGPLQVERCPSLDLSVLQALVGGSVELPRVGRYRLLNEEGRL